MVDPDWHLWRAFLAVARSGSLSAAARDLRATQPTLGRQISALETGLDAALFTRAHDGLRPTDLALRLMPYAESMEAAAAALVREASGSRQTMRGTVRVSASEIMGVVVLPPMLARFHAANPGVDLEVSLNDRPEDLLRREADLAVRHFRPRQEALVARRIGTMPIRFYAHRDYVVRHGLPETVTDLAHHALIGREAHRQRLHPPLAADLRFTFRCDSDLGLLAALRAGFGIGYCQENIGRRDPDLVAVLADVTLVTLEIWLAMHIDLRNVNRIRALFDHLASELKADRVT